jgi:hypothetical protein
MPLAPMLAAAMSVSEAFFYVQGQTPVAGRRSVGFTLWQPGRKNWLEPQSDAPALRYLPSNLCRSGWVTSARPISGRSACCPIPIPPVRP